MIISITVTPITVQLDFWEHATVAHVKMLTHAHLKVMEMFFVIAVQTMLVTDVPVSCIQILYQNIFIEICSSIYILSFNKPHKT